jgi:hypothetical protein
MSSPPAEHRHGHPLRKPEVVAGVDPLLSYDQCCAALGTTRPQLQALISAGKLTPVYVSTRCPRIRASDINALELNAREVRKVRRG